MTYYNLHLPEIKNLLTLQNNYVNDYIKKRDRKLKFQGDRINFLVSSGRISRQRARYAERVAQFDYYMDLIDLYSRRERYIEADDAMRKLHDAAGEITNFVSITGSCSSLAGIAVKRYNSAVKRVYFRRKPL